MIATAGDWDPASAATPRGSGAVVHGRRRRRCSTDHLLPVICHFAILLLFFGSGDEYAVVVRSARSRLFVVVGNIGTKYENGYICSKLFKVIK